MALLLGDVTRSIIGSFYVVYDRLGYGLLERPYVGAMVIELTKAGHDVRREVQVPALYENAIVGDYRADLLVDRSVIVEVKAAPCLTGIHERQLLNYLRCSDVEVGLLLCFGIRAQFKRFIDTNDYKRRRSQLP